MVSTNHQLNSSKNSSDNNSQKTKTAIFKTRFLSKLSLIVVVIAVSVIYFYIRGSQSEIKPDSNKPRNETQEKVSQKITPESKKQTIDDGKPTFACLDPGIVCNKTGGYSFRMDTPYAVITEDVNGIIVSDDSGMITIAKQGLNPAQVLDKYKIPYEKQGEAFVFQLTSSWSDEIPGNMILEGMTVQKGDFVISAFYGEAKKDIVRKTIETIQTSVKGGCGSG